MPKYPIRINSETTQPEIPADGNLIILKLAQAFLTPEEIREAIEAGKHDQKRGGKMKVYTAEEIAELLQLHPETIRRAIREGKLKAARFGRDLRVSQIELARWWQESGGGELIPVAVQASMFPDEKSDRQQKPTPEAPEEPEGE